MSNFHYRFTKGNLEIGADCSGCGKVIASELPLAKPLALLAKGAKLNTEGSVEFPGLYFGCANPQECENYRKAAEKAAERHLKAVE